MPVWACKEANSNKFWGYDILSNTSILVKWGRIGLLGQSKRYDFGSSYERDAFIADKLKEKEDKGYKKEEENRLAREAEAARKLGTQFKIQRTEFVFRKGDDLNIINNYDSSQWIYVEILNSWDKRMNRFLLSTTESLQIEGTSESNRVITCASLAPARGDFVKGVRAYLKFLSEKIIEVVQRRVIGMGSRKLAWDGSASEDSLVATAVASVDVSDEISEATGANRQVVSKLVGGLGSRKLCL